MAESSGAQRPVRVALDAMGGDHAPAAAVEGAVLAARAYGCEVQLVGRADDIGPELARHDIKGLQHLLPVVHAPDVILMNEHPASAVRSKRQSSMAVAVGRVKAGQANCFVSAGNTGAILATALLGFRRIDGITSERPALAAPIPGPRASTILLDAGANVDCKPEWLAQFALMGSLYAELLWDRPNPRVATLSIGEEEGKGNAQLVAAIPLIRALPINYVGNVQGTDVSASVVDVVVADGFAGNIYLKGAEGIVAAFTELLRDELTRSLPRQLMAAALRPAFRALRGRMSYEEYGGVPLLGVNGVCVKAHGRSTGYALQNAIRVGMQCVRLDLVARIRERMADASRAPPAAMTRL